MERFFGGPVIPVLLRLVVLCVVVGVVLSVLGIHPVDLWDDFLATVERVWQLGADILDWSLSYFLLGAVIVVPIWLFIRLWSVMTRSKSDSHSPPKE